MRRVRASKVSHRGSGGASASRRATASRAAASPALARAFSATAARHRAGASGPTRTHGASTKTTSPVAYGCVLLEGTPDASPSITLYAKCSSTYEKLMGAMATSRRCSRTSHFRWTSSYFSISPYSPEKASCVLSRTTAPLTSTPRGSPKRQLQDVQSLARLPGGAFVEDGVWAPRTNSIPILVRTSTAASGSPARRAWA
mmetsp:Transcript_228/g.809  ORF Transcript_228/g.809 Transcript_228/m.809 type:complete len:200 (-) Transcript_228:148-747(-)